MGIVTDTASIRLDKIQCVVRQTVSDYGFRGPGANAYARTVEDFLTRQTAVAFRTYFLGLGQEKREVEWPADWWQHFKARWFPAWAKRRWPVQMTRREFIVYAKVCPHIGSKDDGDHLRWFLDNAPPGAGRE